MACVLAAMLALSACGFQPLYADRPGAPDTVDELKAIEVALIPDRPGQQLRAMLETGFNPRNEPAPDRYTLDVRLTTGRSDIALRKDETATRQNLTVYADYVLRALADGRVLTQGRVRSINGFNVASSDFATRTAEAEALDRSVRELALGIQSQLAIHFRRQARAG